MSSSLCLMKLSSLYLSTSYSTPGGMRPCTTEKNSDWLPNCQILWSTANRIKCQAILCDQNSLLSHVVRTVHHWKAMTISGSLSSPVQRTSQLSLYCFFTMYARNSVQEPYSSKPRSLNWSIIPNIILLWSFALISWGTQQKTFLPRHLRYMDLRSWGTFIVNSFPAGPAVMKAWNNIAHFILREHPRLGPLS